MMEQNLVENLIKITPEIMLASIAIITLVGSSFCERKTILVTKFGIILTVILGYWLLKAMPILEGNVFNYSFANTDLVLSGKIFATIILIFISISYIGYSQISNIPIKSEYIVLMMFSTLGSFIALSARDLLVLFLGLELQALPAYILAAFSRDREQSSEAGLKYFVLGALSACLLLLGASLLYGYTGSLNYAVIAQSWQTGEQINIASFIGIVLIIIAIMFKLSIVPFHMWTPDVYQGAPLLSVALFSSVHKITALIIFAQLVHMLAAKMQLQMVEILQILTILSLLVGSIGGVLQSSLKRLVAYSTIFNSGYALLAITMNLYSSTWSNVFILYMMIYIISSIGLFVLLIANFGDKVEALEIDDLAGLARTKKAGAAAISTIIFSMIGLPPLAGFFAKYYVLYEVIALGHYGLAIIAIITTAIASYYYLRIIKTIYFADPVARAVKLPLTTTLLLPMVLCLSIVLFFGFGVDSLFDNIRITLAL